MPRTRARLLRYAVVGGVGAAVIWTIALAYLGIAAPVYRSNFTLILPGSGEGTTLNLTDIGQASSTSSPFSSPDMSPTENYKRLLLSRPVLLQAARLAEVDVEAFPAPRVELIQQTKLIEVSETGTTPEQAQRNAVALRDAFQATLDRLRQNETELRDAASRSSLENYRDALDRSRHRLVQQQVSSGLVSNDQYNGLVATAAHTTESLRDVEAKLARSEAVVASMTQVLGTSPELANAAMVLRGDPSFQAMLEQYAKDEASLAALSGTRGAANTQVEDLTAERAALAGRMMARSEQLTGRKRPELLRTPDLSLHDDRAMLFQRLIGEVTELQALKAMRDTLRAQQDAQNARILVLAKDAGTLSDLRADVQVAEAVFSSALGKMDSRKADSFISYPLVQTLEAPSLPQLPSAARKLILLAGAGAATVFLILALVMAWLRSELTHKILRSGSSSRHSSEAGPGTFWEPFTS